MIRILLVDDQPTVCHGLRMRLAPEPDRTVVGQAHDGVEALHLAATLHPDVVLMDSEMPDMDGISATTRLHEVVPLSAVVILSIYEDALTRRRALVAGARA